jgi:hypothetical protein
VTALDNQQQPVKGESPAGIFSSISRELHKAIDEVWGGMFQKSVRMEKERQAAALEQKPESD